MNKEDLRLECLRLALLLDGNGQPLTQGVDAITIAERYARFVLGDKEPTQHREMFQTVAGPTSY